MIWKELWKIHATIFSFRLEKQSTTEGFPLQQRGQGNFELATNYDYIHLGQLTQAKVSVSVGFQSLP